MTRKAIHAYQAGNHIEALKQVEKAREAGMLSVELLEIGAQSALATGDLNRALQFIEAVIHQAGATVQRAMFYGDLLTRLGRLQAAADVFQQVIRQQDANPIAWKGLANCLFKAGDWERARAAYSAVVERAPKDLEAKAFLANCILKTGASGGAAAILADVVRDAPDYAMAGVWYAEALRRSGRVEEAIPYLERWESHAEVGGLAKRLLVACWMSIEDYEPVQSVLEPLIRSNPDDPELMILHARWLAVEGQRDESQSVMKRMLKHHPDQFGAWSPYLDTCKQPLDGEMAAMLFDACSRAEQCSDLRDKGAMYFAVARQHQLAGNRDAEMQALVSANRAMAKLSPSDTHKNAGYGQRIIRCYPSSVISTNDADDTAFAPVFILALPRSGTTLLEQALGRHHATVGAGEAGFASEAWHAVTGNWAIISNPESHEKLDAKGLEKFRGAFLSAVSKAGLDKGKVMIHKGINNHKIAGLLAAAFPKARFVALSRSPLDVAYGCFRQNFEFQPFSFTVEGIASEIATYQRNVQWWQQQLGETRLYSTRYEALVDDFEGELRALLAWLGLPWDKNCMDFARASRVGTASMNQVREGVFTTAVNKVSDYGDLFSPFAEALKQEGVIL